MIRYRRLGYAGLLSFAISGCGATSGFLRDSITQVQVQHSGFRLVKTGVTGSAKTGKALCGIIVDDATIYKNAMAELHQSAALTPNQMLVNIREDRKLQAYLFFYCETTLTLSADVIEFGEGGAPPPPPSPPAMVAVPPPAAGPAPGAATPLPPPPPAQ